MTQSLYSMKTDTLTVSDETVMLGSNLVARIHRSGILVVIFGTVSPDVYVVETATPQGYAADIEPVVSLLNGLPDGGVFAVIYRPGQEPEKPESWGMLLHVLRDLGVDGIDNSIGHASSLFLAVKGGDLAQTSNGNYNVSPRPISAQVTVADTAGFSNMLIEAGSGSNFGRTRWTVLKIDGASPLTEMEQRLGLQIAFLDPDANGTRAAKGFSPSKLATVAQVQAFLDPQIVGQRRIAMLLQNNIIDAPTPDLLAVLKDWGFADLANLANDSATARSEGRTYLGLGQQGVVPGLLPDLIAADAWMSMSLHSDEDGLLKTSPLAIAFDQPNFEGNPLRAFRQARGDLTGAGSLMIDPSSGVTLYADPGINDSPPPIFSHWASVPELTNADGQRATTFHLWTAEDKNNYRRSLLEVDGGYLTPLALQDQWKDGDKIFLEQDCLYIVRGERLSDTQQRVDLMAYAPGSHNQLTLRGLMTGSPGLKFVDLGNRIEGNVSGKLCYVPTPKSAESSWHFILEQEAQRKISLKLDQNNAWISFDWTEDPANGDQTPVFGVTLDRDKRAVFSIPVELADRGSLLDKMFRVDGMNYIDGEALGPIGQGSVAVFSEPGQQGEALIFHDNIERFDLFKPSYVAPDDARPRFASFSAGPNTALRLFKSPYFGGPYLDLGPLRSDIPEDWQTGIGSVQVIPSDPGDVGLQASVDLAVDFYGEAEALDVHRVFRATLRVPPSVESLRLRTTAPTELWIGGKSVSVGPDQPIELPAPALGFMSVSIPAERLSCPGLLVQTDVMRDSDWAAFYPDRAAHSRLADHVREDQTAADGADQLTDIHAALGHTFGAIRHEDVPMFAATGHGRRISADAMPHLAWMLDTSPSLERFTRFRHIKDAEQLQSLINTATDGDASSGSSRTRGVHRGVHPWDYIVQNAQKVSSFIVHKVENAAQSTEATLHVAIHYEQDTVDKFERFALSDAQRVVDLGHTIVGALKEDLNSLLDEIKHELHIDDVIAAQTKIKTAFLNAFDWAEGEVAGLATAVEAFLAAEQDTILGGLDHLISELTMRPETTESLRNEVGKPDDHHIDAVKEKAHWLMGRMGAAAKSGDPAAPPAPPTESTFAAFMTVIEEQFSPDSPAFKAMTDALTRLPKIVTAAPSFDLGELLTIVKDIVTAAFDALIAVIKAIAEAIEAALSQTKEGFDQPEELPFISDLYKWLHKTGGNQAPADPSLADLMSFVIAIPTVLISHLTDGTAPFPVTESRKRSIHTDPNYATKRGWGMAAGVTEIVGSVLQTYLDMQVVKETTFTQSNQLTYKIKKYFGPRGQVPKPAKVPKLQSGGLEGLSFGLSVFAQLASWPGGIPFGKFDVSPTARTNDPAEYFDNVTWVVASCALSLDVLSLLISKTCARRSAALPGIIAATVVGCANLALIGVTLHQESKAASSDPGETKLIRTKFAQGLLSGIPKIAPGLRYPPAVRVSEGGTLVALGEIDLFLGAAGGGLLIYMAQEGLIDPETPEAAQSS